MSGNNRFLLDTNAIIALLQGKQSLITTVIDLRRKHRLKLPDAIIAGTAVQYNATLITADKQLHKIDEVAVLDFS